MIASTPPRGLHESGLPAMRELHELSRLLTTSGIELVQEAQIERLGYPVQRLLAVVLEPTMDELRITLEQLGITSFKPHTINGWTTHAHAHDYRGLSIAWHDTTALALSAVDLIAASRDQLSATHQSWLTYDADLWITSQTALSETQATRLASGELSAWLERANTEPVIIQAWQKRSHLGRQVWIAKGLEQAWDRHVKALRFRKTRAEIIGRMLDNQLAHDPHRK